MAAVDTAVSKTCAVINDPCHDEWLLSILHPINIENMVPERLWTSSQGGGQNSLSGSVYICTDPHVKSTKDLFQAH